MNTATRLILFCVLLGVAFCGRAESLTLHDAAFSPDGETIGVGTDEGFQLLDQEGKQVLYSYPVSEGVRLLRWAPDSKRVLLVSWKENEVPNYSLLDIVKNKILFSFPDRVRWYYSYYHSLFSDNPSGAAIGEEIYPRSTELGHPAALTFSPDGEELAYITNDGPIRIRETEKGSLLREFPLSDFHATSLGYTPDGEKMWVGIILNAPEEYTDPTRLLYVDAKSGEILEKKELLYDVTLVKGPELFWVYAMRPDQMYALAVSSLRVVVSVTEIHHYVVDMSLQKPIVSIAAASSSLGLLPRHRAVFAASGIVYGLEEAELTWDSRRYDYSRSTTQLGWDTLGYFPASAPAQPFSPDGHRFVMIENDKLHIVETETLNHQTITLGPASVGDYQRHEWMLLDGVRNCDCLY